MEPLRDSDPSVCCRAAQAAGKQKLRTAVPALVELLYRSGSHNARVERKPLVRLGKSVMFVRFSTWVKRSIGNPIRKGNRRWPLSRKRKESFLMIPATASTWPNLAVSKCTGLGTSSRARTSRLIRTWSELSRLSQPNVQCDSLRTLRRNHSPLKGRSARSGFTKAKKCCQVIRSRVAGSTRRRSTQSNSAAIGPETALAAYISSSAM